MQSGMQHTYSTIDRICGVVCMYYCQTNYLRAASFSSWKSRMYFVLYIARHALRFELIIFFFFVEWFVHRVCLSNCLCLTSIFYRFRRSKSLYVDVPVRSQISRLIRLAYTTSKGNNTKIIKYSSLNLLEMYIRIVQSLVLQLPCFKLKPPCFF